jgi:hypothetical protein
MRQVDDAPFRAASSTCSCSRNCGAAIQYTAPPHSIYAESPFSFDRRTLCVVASARNTEQWSLRQCVEQSVAGLALELAARRLDRLVLIFHQRAMNGRADIHTAQLSTIRRIRWYTADVERCQVLCTICQ